MMNNPYRRQKLMYAFYGKTKEERKEKKAWLKEGLKEFYAEKDREFQE